MSATIENDKKNAWYNSLWAWFIIIVLLTTFGVGFFLISLAMKNPPDLVRADYYDVGKGINVSLQKEKNAKELSLVANLNLQQEDDKTNIQLAISANEEPQKVELLILSPINEKEDLKVDLNKQNGFYQGQTKLLNGRKFIEINGLTSDKEWRLTGEINFDSQNQISLDSSQY